MKKKICALLLCVCMSFCIFTGCTLFQKDALASNREVVAVVGTENITREEVVNLYYTYYYNYYYYIYGYSGDSLMTLVYDSLVTRKLILTEARGVIKLKNSEINELWDKVYKSVNETLDGKIKEYLKADDYKETDKLYKDYIESKDESKNYIYKKYILSALKEISYGDGFVTDDVVISDKNGLPINTADFKEFENKEYRMKAYISWVSDLRTSAKTLGKDDSVDSVVNAELNRIYTVQYESKLVEKYQEYIEQNINITDSDLVGKYNTLVNTDKQTFNNIEAYNKAMTDSERKTIPLYHPTVDGKDNKGYFGVQHILINFTTEMQDILKNLPGSDPAKDEVYRAEYKAKLAEFKAKLENGEIKVAYRENYDETAPGYDKDNYKEISATESKVVFSDVIAEIDALALKIGSEKDYTYTSFAMDFNKLMYKYSQDPGLFNKDKPTYYTGYYVPANEKENGSWAQEFAETSRKLLAQLTFNDDGTVNTTGKLYAYEATTYGIHIIMVTNPTFNEELVKYVSGASDEVIVQAMKNTQISLFTNKTIYDYIYEQVLADKKATYFNKYMADILEKKEQNGFVKYFIKGYDKLMGEKKK
ncbi:MAG: hypothetical protein RR334_00145 [Clostridia bacterium]